MTQALALAALAAGIVLIYAGARDLSPVELVTDAFSRRRRRGRGGGGGGGGRGRDVPRRRIVGPDGTVYWSPGDPPLEPGDPGWVLWQLAVS